MVWSIIMTPTSGMIYQLSNAIEESEETLLVPIIDTFGDSILVGYARMNKMKGSV